uniref:Uncharacterized protein n=1 Tax=Arundo donax TaxID=35708 RepID=A0A0A9DWQ7_ARUDO
MFNFFYLNSQCIGWEKNSICRSKCSGQFTSLSHADIFAPRILMFETLNEIFIALIYLN